MYRKWSYKNLFETQSTHLWLLVIGLDTSNKTKSSLSKIGFLKALNFFLILTHQVPLRFRYILTRTECNVLSVIL